MDGPSADHLNLKDYGWGAHFQAQLGDDDAGALPVRVVAVHRDALEATGPSFEGRIRRSPRRRDDERRDGRRLAV